MSLLCNRIPQGSHVCREQMDSTTDQFGRIRWVCYACKRYDDGQCRTCPRRRVGKSLWCDGCRKRQEDRIDRESWARHGAAWRENAKVAKRVDPAHPMTPRQAGRRGGKCGGKARAMALSPERRREIARLGGMARAAKLSAARRLEISQMGADAARAYFGAA